MLCVFSDLPSCGSSEVANHQTPDLSNPISDPITEALNYAVRVTRDCFTHEDESDALESVNSDAHEDESDAHEDESDAHGSVNSDAHEDESDAHEDESDAHGSVNSDACEEEDSDAHGSVNSDENDSESIAERAFEGNVSESEDDSGAEDMLCTPYGIPLTPERDTFTLLEESIEEFDYEVEVFDWENFHEDLDGIEDMDFSQLLE